MTDWYILGHYIKSAINGRKMMDSSRETDVELDEKKVNNGPLSEELIDIVKRLTMKNPHKRLGIKGTEEVLNHPWFKGVDWGKLERQEYVLDDTPGNSVEKMTKEFEGQAMTQEEQRKIYFKDWAGKNKKGQNGVGEFFTHVTNWFFKAPDKKGKKKGHEEGEEEEEEEE